MRHLHHLGRCLFSYLHFKHSPFATRANYSIETILVWPNTLISQLQSVDEGENNTILEKQLVPISHTAVK